MTKNSYLKKWQDENLGWVTEHGHKAEDWEKDLTPVHSLINTECIQIAEFLINKNRDYKNSFADPINIFCRLSAEDQINCRIDDKLSRIKNTDCKNFNEDTEKDLIGYLILKRVLRNME